MNKYAVRRAVSFLVTGTLLMTLTMNAGAAPIAEEEPVVQENGVCIQTYIPPDETQPHTIYWAKGITPPKMSHDLENYGTAGYFDKSIEPAMPNLSQYIFTYEYDEEQQKFIDRGFYDINKTNHAGGDQKPLCYMATTVNMLHWWMKQNEAYIARYQEGIAQQQFLQEESLYDISTPGLWDDLTAPPELTVTHITEQTPFYMQSIPNDKLSNPYLYPIYRRYRSGGWMDNVAGFFFNGYDPGEPPPQGDGSPTKIPKPENFVPSAKGGFFHPIFGKTPLAVRHRTTSYSFFNTHLKQWLTEEKAVGISFYPTSQGSHAITVWGAEYDSSGNLCRIFITDSDDETRTQLDELGNTPIKQVNGVPVVRTLCSYDVISNGNDEMYLTTSYGDNAYAMDGVVVLSLGTEYWEQAMADRANGTLEPAAPAITKQPVGRSYAIGATASMMTVEASVAQQDLAANGYLTYQWFKTEDPQQDGTPVAGQTHAQFQPPIGKKAATEYYYCQVTSHKYGHHATVKSDTAAIVTTDQPLVNAAKPIFQSFSQENVTCKQGEEVIVTVNAKVTDGGKLYYQWFPVEGNVVSDVPVTERTDSPDFRVPTKTVGKTEYYCQLTNVNEQATGKQENTVMHYNNHVTVTVNARPPQERCTIRFSTPGASPVKPVKAAYGEKIQAPAVPTRSGYRFTGWYENGKPVQFPYEAAGDTVFTAGWEQTGSARGAEYRIDSIALPGGKIPAGNFTVQITITNLASDREDQLVVAAYDSLGRMLSLSTQTLNPADTHAQEKIPTVSVPVENNGAVAQIKAFIVPQKGELLPLSAAQTT